MPMTVQRVLGDVVNICSRLPHHVYVFERNGESLSVGTLVNLLHGGDV